MSASTSPKILNPALLALMEKVRARTASTQLGESRSENQSNSPVSPVSLQLVEPTFSNQYGEQITYNAEQSQFISLVTQPISEVREAVLIGAAGTGKTTCLKGAVTSLIQSPHTSLIRDTCGHKYLTQNSPGILLTSFTRRAVRNLKRAMDSSMESNCITLHKLLEYQPVYYEVYDEEKDKYINTMKFEPTRNQLNPLPSSISTIIFDESSMISCELFDQLLLALPHPSQVRLIFVGDIQQLPPVFGSAILGFKLLSATVVELTQVYRQALESPIIKLATDIRNGIPIPPFTERITEKTTQGKLTLHPWKKKLHPDVACLTAAKFFTVAYDASQYDPLEDQILVPFNKAFGTLELNKHIANHIAKRNSREVWEVIAGFNSHYFSVGDRVLFDKEDAEIIRIARNGTYLGKKAQKESVTLDYWGHNSAPDSNLDAELDLDSIDAFLEAAASSDPEDKVNSSSHLITVRMLDSDEEITIETASEVNSLLLSYALTVHKAQGSEWERVFVLFHQSHSTMLQRELIYTAITRARTELYVICEPDTFQKGVLSQKIRGTTLAEKAEYFKGKLNSREKER